jgi:hypothetical protein
MRGMVRVERIELSSQPWEGYIMATIRYPHWSHLGDSNPGPPLYEFMFIIANFTITLLVYQISNCILDAIVVKNTNFLPC